MATRLPSQRRWGLWLFLVMALGVVALAAAGVVAAYQFYYANRVYPGVRLAGIQLDGMTPQEAAAAVTQGLTPYPGDPITVRYGSRTWSLSASELGVAVDGPASASAAFAVGRRGLTAAPVEGFLMDLTDQWSALRNGIALQPVLRFDGSRLALSLKKIAEEVDLPPREGSLQIAGLEVSSIPGQPGRLVDLAATRAAFDIILQSGKGGTVDLVVEERWPAVLEVEDAARKARGLLGQSFVLVAEGLDGTQRFALEPATLRQWLAISVVPAPEGSVDLAVQLDRTQVQAFVETIAQQLNRPVYDALLDFDREKQEVVVLRQSQPGQRIDVEAGVAMIESAIMEGTKAPASEIGGTREITLPLAILAPRVSSGNIPEMGIVEQISEGTTYFKGSSAERIKNIVNAAEKLRGAVVPPGEQFSFYAWVGDVTTANGFVDSLVILGDRTEVGVGGGVCQVSTTAFRAAFWGGFPILERYPHSYVVGWYGEPGLDASIYTPSADFRFLNDSDNHILIQPEVDLKRASLTFRIYGTRNRTVEAEKAIISNVRPAPKPAYREDPTLSAGTLKQVDWARDGMDVLVKRAIKYEDGREKADQFVSRYRPWQAVFLYGPGTQLPPEALDDPGAGQ